MIKKYFSRLRLGYKKTLLYMLQQVEYVPKEYLKWNRRTKNYGQVMCRQTLDWTLKIKFLYLFLSFMEVIFAIYFASVLIIAPNLFLNPITVCNIILLILFPIILEYFVLLPLILGYHLIQKPREKKIIGLAKKKLSKHKGLRIAIVGSYGKTTAKEVLKTVIGAGKKTAATPGNINQPIGLARFIDKLDGDEEVLIFEMGEFHVGDITQMCELVNPEIGLITGVSEAHLDTFGSLNNVIKTLFEIRDFVKPENLLLNVDNKILKKKADSKNIKYSEGGVQKWKTLKIDAGILETDFILTDTQTKYEIATRLVGSHNISIIAAAIYLADKLGIKKSQIEIGVKNIKPFEHRMEPRFINGAIVIDDTYNGNLEGVRAGIKLLKDADAKRKIYVTPGLVEQGDQKVKIHQEIGKLLSVGIDKVVLMQNSTTQNIVDGLTKNKFKGKLIIVDDPLNFYTNLDKFVASGDAVLMQNDWTDNYY